MSPGVRHRIWSAFHEAAAREAPGSPHRARLRALAGLARFGAGMPALAASLERLTAIQGAAHLRAQGTIIAPKSEDV